jgi:hypothetical protein
MMTRSMLQIMQEFARMVLVPETDVPGGGLILVWSIHRQGSLRVGRQ